MSEVETLIIIYGIGIVINDFIWFYCGRCWEKNKLQTVTKKKS